MSQDLEQAATMLPMDAYNQTLIANVHPSDWINPVPADAYDLVVVGAGTAGLVVAAGAAGLGIGLKIALIEKNLTMIRSATVVGELWNGPALGVAVPRDQINVDFAAVMTRLRHVRSGISHHDSVQRFTQLGIDVFLGAGRFEGSHTIEVAGQTLRFKKAVIATGARAARPAIPGLDQVEFLTNETVFSLTERPDRLAVIGGGPIGCELAQAFRRLGSEVVMLQHADRLLTNAEPAAAEILQQQLIREGVRLVLNAQIERIEQTAVGKTLHVQGQVDPITVDQILIGVGRTPNVDGLDLAAAGVIYGPKGVQVNDYLQTTAPHIFAAGDICMDWKFTHAADAAARLVIKNMLFSPWGLGRAKLSALTMPGVTYTDPEIAQVGWTAAEAARRGVAIKTIEIPLEQVDRAITDGQTAGFFKVHYLADADRVVGATIVARHAGELISMVTMAIEHKLGLSALSRVIFPYPTQAEGLKKAADTYRRGLLTDRTRRLLKWLTRFS
jgi:pyruvate/2-oxoglutarate dehydrogenase complex dihydrolipoamide dehydrogenase (E3) component